MNDDGVPVVRLREVDALQPLLADIRATILKHPVASQAAFSALVEEGRQFASTDEGAELAQALTRSQFAHKLKLVFEVSSGWLVDEERQGLLPSAILDALFLAAQDANPDQLLARLYQSSEINQ